MSNQYWYSEECPGQKLIIPNLGQTIGQNTKLEKSVGVRGLPEDLRRKQNPTYQEGLREEQRCSGGFKTLT